MGNLQFGVALPAVTGIAEFAQQAEELGFDFLACGEHVMFHGPVANTFISLSVAAGATRRIKLLSSVVLLPLYQPVIVAKMGATLDVASGGRYNFGVGIGGEFPTEFEACGVPVNQRGARTNEALEVITKLWTEKNYAQDFSKLANRYALAGTPEECQKRLKEYLDVGAQTVIFPLACRPEYVSENLRLLAHEVIPAFR